MHTFSLSKVNLIMVKSELTLAICKKSDASTTKLGCLLILRKSSPQGLWFPPSLKGHLWFSSPLIRGLFEVMNQICMDQFPEPDEGEANWLTPCGCEPAKWRPAAGHIEQ